MRYIMYQYITLLTLIFFYGCGAIKEEKKEQVKPIKYGVVERSGGLITRTFNGITQSGSET
mgnify:CR=1 FL=1